jgi:hypothetical protein
MIPQLGIVHGQRRWLDCAGEILRYWLFECKKTAGLAPGGFSV